MDAFFASVEQLRHPEWRGKPVIVGGTPEQRGVVCTASYEARAYGIHSAQPAATARKLCPQGIFVLPDNRTYCEISEQIRKIFLSITPLVEPLSIDEAYLDVTELCKNSGETAVHIARRIQYEIYNTLGLTASAGVSFNKFLAKMASGLKKPRGLSVITPETSGDFLRSLPIEDFYGVGPSLARKFRRIGIRSGRELLAFDLDNLKFHFGKAGLDFYNIVRGIDPRPVTPEWQRKSFGREVTFPADITDAADLHPVLKSLAEEVAAMLAAEKMKAFTVTIKIRYGDLRTVTRSQTGSSSITLASEIYTNAARLLTRTEVSHRPVRLLGVSVSKTVNADTTEPPQQMTFQFPAANLAEYSSISSSSREK